MDYSPPLDTPAAYIEFLYRTRTAFAADMLRVIARTGGLTKTQLEEVKKLFDNQQK